MRAPSLHSHRAISVASAIRRGSSSPVVVRTAAGEFLTKLRGAAQGLLPLVSEIIVAELAAVLGLPVPERVLVALDEGTPSDDHTDELLDLLARSQGENLGFRYLRDATDLRADERGRVPADVAAALLWLDGLVMNPDRTAANPNVMLWRRQPWLIDHGAALSFHFDLDGMDEQTPRAALFDWQRHLFAEHAALARRMDEENAAKFTRDVLARATAMVPEGFLLGAFPRLDPVAVRGVYAAFLWKRLKPPRPFLPRES